jgi:hypothetical protein
MGLILKKPLTSETGVRGFSKSGDGFFFLMKTVGWSYPHQLSFFYIVIVHARRIMRYEMKTLYNKG